MKEESQASRRGRDLSHIESDGDSTRARMVDVSEKPSTERRALALACVRFPPDLLDVVLARGGPKGPIEEVARVAGILAAKRTGELIPMCHPLGLDHVEIHFEGKGERLEIRCRTACHGRTGIEMEALTGAAVAALTVIDMTKALDPSISIESVELLEKSGGSSGPWRRPGARSAG